MAMPQRVRGRVMDVSYDDSSELVVEMALRTEHGRRRTVRVYGTVPYCFVHQDASDPELIDSLDDSVEFVQSGYESFDGFSLKQIAVETPDDVRAVRKEYETTWEADLPFVRRCTADYTMSGYVSIPDQKTITVGDIERVDRTAVQTIEPKVCMYDIEVEMPDSFYDGFAEEAPNRVTAITAYDTYADEYTLFCLDPEMAVDAGEIRTHIEENWIDHDEFDRLVDIDIVFKRFGSESNLLQAFADYVADRRFDAFTGWNVVDFDHEYIVNRMHELDDVNPHVMSENGYVGGRRADKYVDGVPAIDMMSAFCDKLSYGKWESRSLDYVSNEVVGGGKVEGADVSFDANRTKFMAYNIVDVQLCAELDDSRGIISFWYLLAEVCGIPPYDVGTTMKECEGYLFKHRESDEILPTTEDKEMDDISGGLVLPGYEGVADWVGVLDLKSLYPSSIITCNISKETMTTDLSEADVVVPDVPLNYEAVSGHKITSDDIGWELGKGACVGFTLDEKGILPKYLEQLFDQRSRMKQLRDQYTPDETEYEQFNQQQRAVKVVMNSFFGVSDHPYFRLSADGLGAAITSVSRYVSWAGIQAIEDAGYDVLYGDTDSLLVSLAEEQNDESVDEFVSMLKELEADVNEGLSMVANTVGLPDEHPHFPEDLHGNGRHAWVYEAEKLYRRFLQAGKKKRYSGNIVWKEGKAVDELDSTGFELGKSDSTELTAEVQSTVMEMALEGESFGSISQYVQEQIQKIENEEHSVRKIGFPTSINKPLREYPNMPVKRACLYSNEHLNMDWQAGDDPWLVYVDETPVGKPNTDVIAIPWTLDELPEGFALNVSKHVEKAVKNPLQSVLPAFDFTWKELKSGKREQSFMGGFGD